VEQNDGIVCIAAMTSLPFQRHYPPVPLRHCYTFERVYEPPQCHLRTSYPLIEDVQTPSPGSSIVSGQEGNDLTRDRNPGGIGRMTATPNEELEHALAQVPHNLRQQLGLSADTIVRLQVS
jgi:hypothetical protein